MRSGRRRYRSIGGPTSLLAGGLLAVATSMLGCSPPAASPTSPASPTVAPTSPPRTPSPAPTSQPSQAPTSFVWAAQPDAFPGEAGASLIDVAAGPAGVVALSSRVDDASPTTLLWGSADGLTWQRISPTGLLDRVYISGVWGAAGQYWLRGQFPDSDDPGTLYRSSDGLAWHASRSVSVDIQIASIVDGCEASTTGARDACPVFLTGTTGVDGLILRSIDAGDTWAAASIDDATGWRGVQDAAPVEILGLGVTSHELIAFGNGLPKATDTGGYLQARFWRSTDAAVSWTRVPNAAPVGDLYVRDLAVADQLLVAAGEGLADQAAVVLRSTDGGRTWARSTTSGAAADGSIFQVLAAPEGFVGLGFANPARIDSFPVREFVWTSPDGLRWRTNPAGDLEAGIVDDAVPFGGLIIAVGRAWTTEQTGTLEAPVGPAAWVLRP
jgi:hypothetical protein